MELVVAFQSGIPSMCFLRVVVQLLVSIGADIYKIDLTVTLLPVCQEETIEKNGHPGDKWYLDCMPPW